jgi:hypothetical protein
MSQSAHGCRSGRGCGTGSTAASATSSRRCAARTRIRATSSSCRWPPGHAWRRGAQRAGVPGSRRAPRADPWPRHPRARAARQPAAGRSPRTRLTRLPRPSGTAPPRPGRPAAPQAASLTGKFRSSGKQSVAHTREIHLISKIYPLTGAGRASDRPSCYGGAGRGRRDGCRGRCLLGDHRHGAAAHRAGSTFVSWI